MPKTVQIDDIDEKILHYLIEDARASLKDMSKQCGISSVSVLNRIKRLKKLGVITGATMFPYIQKIGFPIVATIGMETDKNPKEILEFFNQHTYLIEPSTSVGVYDLCALVYAENLNSLNERVEMVRRRFGIRKIVVNVWSGSPYMNFSNVDLRPNKEC
jgi:Lrp/AsnC family transcriptional regulator, leucine-responsive regulatory protein